MRVLLVKPWSDHFNWYRSHMLGLAYLAAYLREQGHAVEIADGAFHGMTPDALLREAASRSASADVVGVTAMTHEIPRVRRILRAVRAANPGIVTALGGPHATARPAETIDEIPDLDFAISGEGELTFATLLETLAAGDSAFDRISGLAYRNGSRATFNGPARTFVDLTRAPQPAVDLYYERDHFRRAGGGEYRLLASRGCPFQCVYCMRVLGQKVRWRDPDAVIAEWEKAVRYYGATEIFIHDEIFLYNTPQAHRILDGVIAAGLHKEAYFNAFSHVKLVGKEILEKAARANCRKICIGVESGNNEILRNSKRPYTIDEADEAVQTIKAAGIHPFTFFILGHPGESHRSVMDTIRAAVRLNPYEIGLGVMVPYPGTEIYKMAKEGVGGYRLADVDWDGYDRYGGTALTFDRFTQRQLFLYQILGYLAFFLLNGRFRGMIRYLKPKFRAVLRLAMGKGLGR